MSLNSGQKILYDDSVTWNGSTVKVILWLSVHELPMNGTSTLELMNCKYSNCTNSVSMREIPFYIHNVYLSTYNQYVIS